MVSLEEKKSYEGHIKGNLKLSAFSNLLSEKSFLNPNLQDLNEADTIYFGIVQAISSKNKGLFELHFNKKNKSNPSKDYSSPFVNDDFLIFSLIVGILQFECERSWIKSIVSLRPRSQITITLENILNENFQSKSNLPEIVTVFSKLCKPSLLTNELLTLTYKSINENSGLLENKNDFYILCSLRAYDVVVEHKISVDGSEFDLLRKFKPIFISRIKVLAWLVQTAIIILVLYGVIAIVSLNSSIRVAFDKIGSVVTVLGIFGISQIGNIFPYLRKKVVEGLLYLFGYPKPLILEFRSEKIK